MPVTSSSIKRLTSTMTKLYKTILLFFLAFTFSSCNFFYSAILGVKTKVAWVTKETLKKKAKKHDIPLAQCYSLDTSSLKKAFLQFYKEKRNQLPDSLTTADSLIWKSWKRSKHDDLQPVHIYYFDKERKPIYHMINCYVHPVFPKMNWNIDSSFNFFPPRPFSPLNDSLYFNLDFFLPHIHKIDGSVIAKDSLPEADYYAVIIWNDFMKRPSRSLIKTIQKYHSKHKDQNIHTLYVNNTNSIIWPYMNQEQREEVLKVEEQ